MHVMYLQFMSQIMFNILKLVSIYVRTHKILLLCLYPHICRHTCGYYGNHYTSFFLSCVRLKQCVYAIPPQSFIEIILVLNYGLIHKPQLSHTIMQKPSPMLVLMQQYITPKFTFISHYKTKISPQFQIPFLYIIIAASSIK